MPPCCHFMPTRLFCSREGKGDSDDDESTASLAEPLSRRLASLSDNSSGTAHAGSQLTTAGAASSNLTTSLASQLFGEKRAKSDAPDIIDEGGAASAASSADTTIAEPLFALLEEICELRGMGKWHRKTLVSIVQMTYGKNITRSEIFWVD